MDQRIGTLTRNGETVFYAFAHGYDRPAVEGSQAEVETALGLRRPSRKAPPRRTYIVTLDWRGGASEEISVEATSTAEAIKLGRDWKNAEYGRTRSCNTLPCGFRARRSH